MDRLYREQYLTRKHCNEIGWSKQIARPPYKGEQVASRQSPSIPQQLLRRVMIGFVHLLLQLKETGPQRLETLRIRLHTMTGIWL